MSISLKYAVVERERRYLLASLPDWLDVVADVSDDERWTGAQLAR